MVGKAAMKCSLGAHPQLLGWSVYLCMWLCLVRWGFFCREVKMCRWISVFWSKDEESMKEMLRRSSVQITVLFRTVTHVVSAPSRGAFELSSMNFAFVKGARLTALETEPFYLSTEQAQHRQQHCELPHSVSSMCPNPVLEEPPVEVRRQFSLFMSCQSLASLPGGWAGCQLMPANMGTSRVWAGACSRFPGT